MYAVPVMINSGIRIVGRLGVRGSVWHNLLMVMEKWKMIGKDSKDPPALLGVLVNQHKSSSGDMSGDCEIA